MRYPMEMVPCYKDYLWGGNRLACEYGKQNTPEITAESWELASRKDGYSVVGNGAFRGKTLRDLQDLGQRKYFGIDCLSAEFPILVKLIDAKKDLSIQVHPSDETADTQQGEQGKAEMWYVVDALPKAYLYYGFSRRITPAELKQRSQDGTICQVLNRVSVKRGDVFYILPGTIHAIGAGLLIAEIQQNSNTTFRVYDYQRMDKDGKLRPLHLQRAAQVTDYTPVVPEECRVNSGVSLPGFSMWEMFSCKYFKAYRFEVDSVATLTCEGKSFHHLLFVEGEGLIRCQGKTYPFGKGTSYFMPASLGDYTVEGQCRMLLSRI